MHRRAVPKNTVLGPRSPDPALRDFWLLLKVRMTWKGTRFKAIQGIQAARTVQLKTLNKRTLKRPTDIGVSGVVTVPDTEQVMKCNGFKCNAENSTMLTLLTTHCS